MTTSISNAAAVAPGESISRVGLSDDSVARRGMVTKLWAALGVLSLIFAVYVMVRWIGSGHFLPRPIGVDEPTVAQKAFAIYFNIMSPLTAAWVFWKWLIKPWREQGRITDDGILLLALHTMWFPYDLFINSLAPTFVYSCWGPTLGGWMGDVPTTITPNAGFIPATPVVSFFRIRGPSSCRLFLAASSSKNYGPDGRIKVISPTSDSFGRHSLCSDSRNSFRSISSLCRSRQPSVP